MNRKHEIRQKKQIQNKSDNNKCKWRKCSIYRKTYQTEVKKKNTAIVIHLKHNDKEK